MKLKAIHLFLLLLVILFFSCCLGTVIEGYTERTAQENEVDASNNDADADADTDTDSATIYKRETGNSATIYRGENGNNAVVTDTPSNLGGDPNIETGTNTAYGPNGGSAEVKEGPYGAQAAKITGPAGNSAVVVANQNGVRRREIPRGDEDLYILKSEIVPPVCPKCPSICPSSSRTEPAPPCPACARCPEPAFDCKKVPNYNSNNSSYLPKPMLSDFSTFGS